MDWKGGTEIKATVKYKLNYFECIQLCRTELWKVLNSLLDEFANNFIDILKPHGVGPL